MEEKIFPPIQVILVDDHAVVRAGIRQFLERSGDIKVVVEAANGEEARPLIEKHHLDVAVLDIQMPKMNGIELARWIHSHFPALGILVLTAYDDEPYIQAALKAGAHGYVLKTSIPEDIVNAVFDVYEGKQVLDATLNRRLINRLEGEDVRTLLESLTGREIEVLALTGKGHTNKAIGHQLGISNRTVQNHLAHIFAKLQAASRTEAVMRAVSLGLLSSDLVGNDHE
jgi:DNA-binding NarL/FixJ family response regulator